MTPGGAREAGRGGGAGAGLAQAWCAEVRGELEASMRRTADVDGMGAARRLALSLERGGPGGVRGAMARVTRTVREEIHGVGRGHVMDPMIHGLLANVFARPGFIGFLAPFIRDVYPKIYGLDSRAGTITELVRTVLLYLYADARLDGGRAGLVRACHGALAKLASRDGMPQLARLLSGPAAGPAAPGSWQAVERLVYIYHMVSEKHEAVRRADVGDTLRPYPSLAPYVGIGRAGGALARLPPLAAHLAVCRTVGRLGEDRHEPGVDERWVEWRRACGARFVACEGKNPLPALDAMIRRRGRSPQDARWGEMLLTGSFDQAVAEMAAWEALAGIPGARIAAARGATGTVRLDSGGAGCAVAIHAAKNHLPFLADTLYSTTSPMLQRHHDHVARRVRGEVLAAAARARRAGRGGDPAIVVVDDSLGSVGELGVAESAMRARGAPDAVIVMRGGACRAHARGRRAREARRACAAFAGALSSARSAR